MSDPLRVHAWFDQLNCEYRYVIEIKDIDGSRLHVVPGGSQGTIRTPKFASAPPEVITHLSEEEAQLLVDALYEAGVHPKAYVPSRGELDRLEAHLKDMQAIVRKELGL